MNRQRLLVGCLVAAMMAHTSVMAFDDLSKAGDAAAKAIALVKQVREAAGGEENLAKVCGVTAKGTVRRSTPEGDVTSPFAFKLFTRTVTHGDAIEGGMPKVGTSDRVVIVRRGEAAEGVASGEISVDATHDGPKRIVVRTHEQGADANGKADVIVLTGPDGAAPEKFNIRIPAPGEAGDGASKRAMVFRKEPGAAGDVIVAGQPARFIAAPMMHGRALEVLLSVLTTKGEAGTSFSYAGLLDTPTGRFETLDFTLPDGLAGRLYVDPVSHRPAMVTYKSIGPRIVHLEGPPPAAGESGDKTWTVRTIPDEPIGEAIEVEVRFDDFRQSGSFVLPHRITVTSAGNVVEEISLESFTLSDSTDTN